MTTTEVEDLLGRQQRGKRWTMAAFLTAGGLGVALVFLLSPGNSFDAYSIGDLCVRDCGRVAGNPLLCLRNEEGSSYCSRPCGELFPNCPEYFDCELVREDDIAIDHQGVAAESYCLRAVETPPPASATAAEPEPPKVATTSI